MQRARSTASIYIPVKPDLGTCKLLLELLSYGVSMTLGNDPSFLYSDTHLARVGALLLQQEVRCMQPHCPHLLSGGSTSHGGLTHCRGLDLVYSPSALVIVNTVPLEPCNALTDSLNTRLPSASRMRQTNCVPVSLLLCYFCHRHEKNMLRLAGHRRRMKITWIRNVPAKVPQASSA